MALTPILVMALSACGGDTAGAARGTSSTRDGGGGLGGASKEAAAPGTAGAGGRGGGGVSPREAGHSAGGGGSHDASANADGGRDGSVTFFEGDAGPEPPPYCVAPCVWTVVKHCIPALDTCVSDADAGPVHGYDTVTCDPTTGWSEFEGVTGIKLSAFEVRRAGQTCFRWSYSGALFPSIMASLIDSSGRTAATDFGGGMVACVSLSDVASPASITDAGIPLKDGTVAPIYRMDRSRPECAPWEATGLPVTPKCTTTRSGVCP